MTLTPEQLFASPNPLAQHYSRFRVTERVLLTGHSHQAWPDVGFAGQQEAWTDAAALVDDKWDHAFAKADRVRRGFATLLNDDSGHIALGVNTHEMVVRLLSALPLGERPRLVTTDGEFHTIRRQLDRLAEERLTVVRVPALPAAGLAERLAAATDDHTAAVLASSVLFENAHIVPGLDLVAERCRRVGAVFLMDVYHQLNAVPLALAAEGLEGAFVVGGGYKYCQLGEGNCFLRFPRDTTLRPVITGWYAEFEALSERADGQVHYGAGAARFAGATYDPTSHYRAARVFDFFAEHGLTADVLRAVSQHQVGLLAQRFDALDLDPAVITRDRSVDVAQLGPFLAVQSAHAARLQTLLRERGIHTDHRADILRLGPAPYLSDAQLQQAMDALAESCGRLEV